MRAYRVEQIDGPFLEVDLTMPKPRAGEALVHVLAGSTRSMSKFARVKPGALSN